MASLSLLANAQFDGSREDAILALVRGWVDSIGPFTPGELANALTLPEDDVLYALGQLENEGVVLRGSYRQGVEGEEFCDRRILARIHRSTIDSLRSQVEPVSPAAFIRFLLEWQHVTPESRLHGEGGLLSVIEKLQGFEVAAGVVEEEIFAARVAEYSGIMLDRLCLSGEVVWGRFSARRGAGSSTSPSVGRSAFSRFTPVSLALRESLDWLLPDNDPAASELTGAPKEALAYMQERGASFQSDIAAATKRLPSDVEEALWTLAAAGLATADGLDALRQRLRGTKRPRRPSFDKPKANGKSRASGAGRFRSYAPSGGGSGWGRSRTAGSRWWLLEAPETVEDRAEAVAWQLLYRYGILFPELLARDSLSLRWRDLARILRRLEARGEIRGGRFVSGFVGEQFALPEAADALRRWRNREPDDRLVIVSGCDPLNLAGILTPGPRVTSAPRNRLAYRNGVPIAAMDGSEFVPLSSASNNFAPDGVLERARTLLSVPISHANFRLGQQAAATA